MNFMNLWLCIVIWVIIGILSGIKIILMDDDLDVKKLIGAVFIGGAAGLITLIIVIAGLIQRSRFFHRLFNTILIENDDKRETKKKARRERRERERREMRIPEDTFRIQ